MKTLEPNAESAIYALSEISAILVKRPDLAECFRDLVDSGLPLFSANVSDMPADTRNAIVRYEPSDGMKAFLIALRARNGKFDDPLKFTSVAVLHSYSSILKSPAPSA